MLATTPSSARLALTRRCACVFVHIWDRKGKTEYTSTLHISSLPARQSIDRIPPPIMDINNSKPPQLHSSSLRPDTHP